MATKLSTWVLNNPEYDRPGQTEPGASPDRPEPGHVCLDPHLVPLPGSARLALGPGCAWA
jgi:hypothetical protein